MSHSDYDYSIKNPPLGRDGRNLGNKGNPRLLPFPREAHHRQPLLHPGLETPSTDSLPVFNAPTGAPRL